MPKLYLPLTAALMLVGLLVHDWRSRNVPENYYASASVDQPLLQMPFPVGTVVVCNQGNKSPQGRTHSVFNCLHALDFSLQPPAAGVAAAADGVVLKVINGSWPGDTSVGAGFGNQVRVLHENGYYTLYSHLERIDVVEGETVSAGQTIGTLGETGNAGYPHLHFSLHREPSDMHYPPASVPIGRLVVADMSVDGAVKTLSSELFQSTHLEWDTENHWYGAVSDQVDGALLADLQDEYTQQLEYATLLDSNEIVQRVDRIGPEKVIKQLQTRVDLLDPHDTSAYYYMGGVYWEWLKDRDSAVQAYALIEAIDEEGHNGIAWTIPWSLVQRGEIAVQSGDAASARALFERALTYEDTHDTGFRSQAEAGLERLARAEPSPVENP